MNKFIELMTAGRSLKKVYGKLLSGICRQYGLSRIEVDILLFLTNNPQTDTASDIVTLRALPKSNVSAALESLVQRNLLTKTADKKDRRILHLHIEDSALPIVDEARRQQAELGRIICRGISEEERITMDIVFNKMYKNLKEAL